MPIIVSLLMLVSSFIFWVLVLGGQLPTNTSAGDSTIALAINRTPLPYVNNPAVNTILNEGQWQLVQSLSPPDFLAQRPKDPSNKYLLNKQAMALGKLLFFSPALSGTGEHSCASCHNPELDWTDGLALAQGANEGLRNSPSLWNNHKSRWFFWDGRSDSAWSQALGPIENPDEMAGDRLQVLKNILADHTLKAAYVKTFGKGIEALSLPVYPDKASPLTQAIDPEAYINWQQLTPDQQHMVNMHFSHVGKALAAFEATLVSPPSDFDRYVAALRRGETVGRDSEVFNGQALAGLKLFVGKAGCMTCHMGGLLSNGEFHNIRLFNHDGGRYEGIRHLLEDEFNQLGHYSDADPKQKNKAVTRYVKQVKRNWGEFKVPSLRRVAFTAPYMHDGRFTTLEQVVDFYSELEGAVADEHVNETIIKPLELTAEEKAALVVFLGRL